MAKTYRCRSPKIGRGQAYMPEVCRQGRQLRAEIGLLLVPHQQPEHSESVTEIMEAEGAAGAVARNVGSHENLVKRGGKCGVGVPAARRGYKERRVGRARADVALDRQAAALKPSDDVGREGDETRLAKLGVPYAQNGAREVDVREGEAEHFARPQSREIQEDQGGAQDDVADRGPSPCPQPLAGNEETTPLFL